MRLVTLTFLSLTIIFHECGIIGFIVFLLLKYYSAAVWSLVTGIAAGLVAHVNFLHYKNRLSNWYGLEELDYVNRLAFAFIAVTISGFVYHLVYYGLTIYHNYAYNAGIIHAVIQSAISGFWSVILKLLVDKIYTQLISKN